MSFVTNEEKVVFIILNGWSSLLSSPLVDYTKMKPSENNWYFGREDGYMLINPGDMPVEDGNLCWADPIAQGDIIWGYFTLDDAYKISSRGLLP